MTGRRPPPARTRGLTARSVLASSMLGQDPPELPVAQLVRLAGLFGITENGARVALSRMVAAGEVTTDGSGTYRLAGPLVARAGRQRASRRAARTAWDGSWVTVVFCGPGRTPRERAEQRRALAFARLGELREGVWMRPDNLGGDRPDAGGGDPDVLVFAAKPPGAAALARRIWDLEAWADRARALTAELEGLDPSRPESLRPGFVLSAAVLRHFQADPLLPDELLDAAWPGSALRDRYAGWDRAYRETLVAWSSGH